MQPVSQSERIDSLDALRGFSLLGIPLLNIVSLALPFAASTSVYFTPTLSGSAKALNGSGLVLAMWACNLVLSPLWLGYFRFGPAEWAWRSLTYWQRQPMRRQPPVPAGMMETSS